MQLAAVAEPTIKYMHGVLVRAVLVTVQAKAAALQVLLLLAGLQLLQLLAELIVVVVVVAQVIQHLMLAHQVAQVLL
jgi:hypothetical protein